MNANKYYKLLIALYAFGSIIFTAIFIVMVIEYIKTDYINIFVVIFFFVIMVISDASFFYILMKYKNGIR